MDYPLFGYDARVSNEFKIFTDVDSAIVDPKRTLRIIVLYREKLTNV